MVSADPQHVHSARLPWDLSSVPASRQDLSHFLADLDVGRWALDEATHVLTELVANAVEHGRPDEEGQFEVRWSLEGRTLVITVRDSGTPDDGQVIAELPPSLDSPDGRGLLMVAAFSDRWHAERGTDGTTVTAWLRLPERG